MLLKCIVIYTTAMLACLWLPILETLRGDGAGTLQCTVDWHGMMHEELLYDRLGSSLKARPSAT